MARILGLEKKPTQGGWVRIPTSIGILTLNLPGVWFLFLIGFWSSYTLTLGRGFGVIHTRKGCQCLMPVPPVAPLFSEIVMDGGLWLGRQLSYLRIGICITRN